jgi:hypothetical protein
MLVLVWPKAVSLYAYCHFRLGRLEFQFRACVRSYPSQ